MSIIKGKDEIIKIAQKIAKDMGIEKHEIPNSTKCYDIYILAVREYDQRQKNKNDKYKDLGFASAKIDDIANFIPARISSILMAIGSFILKYNYKDALKISIRDRKNHKSPNCAYPEGAVAGALGIQLGGTNIYFGKAVYKPTIGDKHREIEVDDIVKTNKIMYATSIISIVVFTIIFKFLY